jgi:serine/threonine protein kinase
MNSLSANDGATPVSAEGQDREKSRVGISLETEHGDALNYADYYTTQDKVAKGSYGTVYIAKHKLTQEKFAVKVISRARLSAKDKNLVEREVEIMKDCRDVENVVRLVDYFASPETFYVVQVFAEGGKVP